VKRRGCFCTKFRRSIESIANRQDAWPWDYYIHITQSHAPPHFSSAHTHEATTTIHAAHAPYPEPVRAPHPLVSYRMGMGGARCKGYEVQRWGSTMHRQGLRRRGFWKSLDEESLDWDFSWLPLWAEGFLDNPTQLTYSFVANYSNLSCGLLVSSAKMMGDKTCKRANSHFVIAVLCSATSLLRQVGRAVALHDASYFGTEAGAERSCMIAVYALRSFALVRVVFFLFVLPRRFGVRAAVRMAGWLVFELLERLGDQSCSNTQEMLPWPQWLCRFSATV
jgi:hypothetical protein